MATLDETALSHATIIASVFRQEVWRDSVSSQKASARQAQPAAERVISEAEPEVAGPPVAVG